MARAAATVGCSSRPAPAQCTRSCRDLEIQDLLKSWALCGIGPELVEDPWLPSSGFSEAEEREMGNLEM